MSDAGGPVLGVIVAASIGVGVWLYTRANNASIDRLAAFRRHQYEQRMAQHQAQQHAAWQAEQQRQHAIMNEQARLQAWHAAQFQQQQPQSQQVIERQTVVIKCRFCGHLNDQIARTCGGCGASV